MLFNVGEYKVKAKAQESTPRFTKVQPQRVVYVLPKTSLKSSSTMQSTITK